MAPLQSVADFYAAQQQRTLAATLAARAEWSKLSKPDDFGRVANRLLGLIGSAQLGAARDGVAMVPAALEESGFAEPQLARVDPAGFAGWASDGRTMESLLWQAPRIADEAGGPLVQRMAAGSNWLDLMVHQQIIDAGRGASGVTITATRNAGWVRYVNPPCCQNCAVLAGKFFRHNAGFERHWRCDCQHRPASESEPPEGYTDTIQPDQIHDLTEAQRKAVEDGADLNQVVNAYRRVTPSRRTQMFTTTEGTTRRGWASYVRRNIDREQGVATAETATNVGRRGAVGNYTVRRTQARMSPELVYKVARNREEAILLLQKNGYVVGDLRQIAKHATGTMRSIAEREAAKAAAKRYAIDELTDAEADDLLMKLTDEGDWEGAERVGELIDARAKAAKPKPFTPDPSDAHNPQTYEWFEALSEDEQFAFLDRLPNSQSFMENQWAHANARSAPKRAAIPTEREIRAEWDAWIETDWVKLEEATNGVTLTREARAAGHRTRDLYRANPTTARKWASEEVRRYWDANGRMTYESFKAGYAGGVESLGKSTAEYWA